jgi:hypothetical protein
LDLTGAWAIDGVRHGAGLETRVGDNPMFMRKVAAALVAAAFLSLAGAAKAANFVDATLGDVPPDQLFVVSNPKPVQILFQFKTNGAPNARATTYLNAQITDLARGSNLFSEVSTGPVEGGAILTITIDNIPSEGAISRLTFGLIGSLVTDDYVANVEYASGAGTATISKHARHALYATIGRHDPPPNGVRVRNVEEGVRIVVRQLVTHMLNDLAKDPGFNPAPAAPPEQASSAPPPEQAPQADAAPKAPSQTPTAPVQPAPTN